MKWSFVFAFVFQDGDEQFVVKKGEVVKGQFRVLEIKGETVLMGYTNPKRTGPYLKYHDLIVDAYGEPGEDYPPSMENRRDRMPRISVRDVLDRVERWRTRYQSAVTGPKL